MILVTGGAGLLGKALIDRLLLNGDTVKAIYNSTPISISHPRLMVEHADILDVVAMEKAMEGIDSIYHCAGMVSFSPKDERKLYAINVEGTANIVNAALSAGVRRLVHVSSVAALGRPRQKESISETMKWTPATGNSKYGHSKYLGEMEVWRGVAEGLDAVVVNPTIMLGPADWNEGSTKIFKTAYEEFPWYSSGVTGFVDARDVAGAMIILMNSDVTEERFIISAGNHSYRLIFDMIARAFRKKLPSKKVTPFIASAVWRLEALRGFFTGHVPLVTKETASSAQAKVYFNNSKFLERFPGFGYTALDETIAYTVASLQQIINKQ